MDNLCHTLVGAAIGEAGLKGRAKHGNLVLMVAANLPDIDVLAFLSDTPAVALRRGWTHGVLAQALLPVIMTGALVAFERLRPRPPGADPARAAPLLLLCYAGVISHVLLDWLNNYGVRLLMPFSSRWFYGDSVFIVDPWLWLLLGAGALLARRYSPLAARAALILATMYVAVMMALAFSSRAHVLAAWARHHPDPPRALMVGPVPINPLRKAIILDDGTQYHTGSFDWWAGSVTYARATPRLPDHPAVARARDHPDIRAVLVWARFPYYEVRPTSAGTEVTLRDRRFGAAVGEVRVVVPADP